MTTADLNEALAQIMEAPITDDPPVVIERDGEQVAATGWRFEDGRLVLVVG